MQAQLIGAVGRSMDPLFQALGEMPVDVLQSFFASLDPLSLLAKFRRFADMAGDHARKFVALEDWLNDGVGLAAPVARECLTQWYGENTTGARQVADRGPSRCGRKNCDLPALAMVPASDRIVPPKSALALARAHAALRDHDARRRSHRHDGRRLRPRQGMGPARCLAPAICRKLDPVLAPDTQAP